jgi:hypothetical protein
VYYPPLTLILKYATHHQRRSARLREREQKQLTGNSRQFTAIAAALLFLSFLSPTKLNRGAMVSFDVQNSELQRSPKKKSNETHT